MSICICSLCLFLAFVLYVCSLHLFFMFVPCVCSLCLFFMKHVEPYPIDIFLWISTALHPFATKILITERCSILQHAFYLTFLFITKTLKLFILIGKRNFIHVNKKKNKKKKLSFYLNYESLCWKIHRIYWMTLVHQHSFKMAIDKSQTPCGNRAKQPPLLPWRGVIFKLKLLKLKSYVKLKVKVWSKSNLELNGFVRFRLGGRVFFLNCHLWRWKNLLLDLQSFWKNITKTWHCKRYLGTSRHYPTFTELY